MAILIWRWVPSEAHGQWCISPGKWEENKTHLAQCVFQKTVIWGLHHGLASLNCICNPPLSNNICVEGGITPPAQLPRERGGREWPVVKHIAWARPLCQHHPTSPSPAWHQPISQVKTLRLKAVTGSPQANAQDEDVSLCFSHLFMSLTPLFSSWTEKPLSPFYLQCPAECRICRRCLINTQWVDGISPK